MQKRYVVLIIILLMVIVGLVNATSSSPDCYKSASIGNSQQLLSHRWAMGYTSHYAAQGPRCQHQRPLDRV